MPITTPFSITTPVDTVFCSGSNWDDGPKCKDKAEFQTKAKDELRRTLKDKYKLGLGNNWSVEQLSTVYTVFRRGFNVSSSNSATVKLAALIFAEGFTEAEQSLLTSLAEKTGLDFGDTVFSAFQANPVTVGQASGSAGNIGINTGPGGFFDLSTEEQLFTLREEIAHGVQNIIEVGKGTARAAEEAAKDWAGDFGSMEFTPFIMPVPQQWPGSPATIMG
jgi:hypothetical protein